MMADVFISYSQKSAEPAKALADTLKAKGIDIWWDVRLVAGERFDDVIRDQLLGADAVIVIWTADSVQSTYVRMEAGIAWAFDKLIPVRVAELQPASIPGPFRDLHTDDVADIDRVLHALAAKDISPQGPSSRKNLSKEEIIQALGRLDSSLPGKVETWLRRCQEEGFRIVIKRSMMVKASIPHFAEVNFGTLYQDGTFQTNYISESSERLGDTTIAAGYLDGVANLVGGAVRREGKSWAWRVEVFGALPKIADALAKGDEWIGLMKEARQRFIKVAAAKSLER
jgi:TIR domain